MNCDEFRSHRLAGEQVEGMHGHLDGCAECRGLIADLDAGRAALEDPALWEEPSQDLGEQIERLLASSGPAVPGPSRRWVGAGLSIAATVIAAAGLVAAFRSAAPDWSVDISGTALAAGASGIVDGWNTESGTRMRLRATGLDRAPEGYVYEFWLSDGPIHISAGTFRSAEEVELWAGVTRADFPRLWVTLEPIDENESPTDQTVLDTGA